MAVVILALYRLMAPLAALALPLFARFSPKLAATLRWRRESPGAAGIRSGAFPRYLVHASSAGELEQARPIMAEIRRRHPEAAILATLSSASARRAAEDLPEADRAIPMPADTPRAMAQLCEDFAPDLVFVVKWDLWPNLMGEAKRRGLPIFLLGGVLSAESRRARWPGRLLSRPVHAMLDGVGAATESDAEQFRRLGVPSARMEVTGDTRFDRVLERREEGRPYPLADSPHARETCLVAGSSWPAEEGMLLEAYPRILAEHPEARLLVAPHEPSEENLRRLEEASSRAGLPSARMSSLGEMPAGCVVLADSLGVLAELYALGSLALVGGGFGDGVHSVLEPAAHGLPVLMGPRIGRAAEAGEMVSEGAGLVIRDANELEAAWRLHLEDPARRERSSARALQFVESGAGAAPRSLDFAERTLGSIGKLG